MTIKSRSRQCGCALLIVAAATLAGCGHAGDPKRAGSSNESGEAAVDEAVVFVSNAQWNAIQAFPEDAVFFASATAPIKSLDGLKDDEVASWARYGKGPLLVGADFTPYVKRLLAAGGRENTPVGLRVIGPGGENVKFRHNRSLRLFVTQESFSQQITDGGGIRIRFVEAQPGGSFKIWVIPRSPDADHWKDYRIGAWKAARDLNVDIYQWEPGREYAVTDQVQFVEDVIARRVDGILLEPLQDDPALRKAVARAKEAAIPTVVLRTPLSDGSVITRVGLDDREIGRKAADCLAELIDDKGHVVMLRSPADHLFSNNTETGFLEAIEKHSDITVVASPRIHAEVVGAKRVAVDLIYRVPTMRGVFCSTPVASLGTWLALRDGGNAERVKVVGVGGNPELTEGLRSGEIDTLILLDPPSMAYVGLKALVDHLRGREVPSHIRAGWRIATPENCDTPEVQNLTGMNGLNDKKR